MASTSKAEDLGPEWQYIRPLGRGAHGTVYLYRQTDTLVQFAVKFLDRKSIGKRVRQEIMAQSALRHRNLTMFKEIILTPTKLAIVMEYSEGGDLHSYVTGQHNKLLRESVARYFFQQLIIGVDHMHKEGYAHRDIKLENLLLNGNPPILKICDFGYTALNSNKAFSKVGTAAYMAPELLYSKVGSYDVAAIDVWSCGVVLHTMLTGIYPFCNPKDPNNERSSMAKIVAYSQGAASYVPPQNASKACQQLLSSMLVPTANKRLTVAGIQGNAWFQQLLPKDFKSPSFEQPTFPQQPREALCQILERAKAGLSTGGELPTCGKIAKAPEPVVIKNSASKCPVAVEAGVPPASLEHNSTRASTPTVASDSLEECNASVAGNAQQARQHSSEESPANPRGAVAKREGRLFLPSWESIRLKTCNPCDKVHTMPTTQVL